MVTVKMDGNSESRRLSHRLRISKNGKKTLMTRILNLSGKREILLDLRLLHFSMVMVKMAGHFPKRVTKINGRKISMKENQFLLLREVKLHHFSMVMVPMDGEMENQNQH